MPPWIETNLQEVLTGVWWLMVAALGAVGVKVQMNRAAAPPLPPPQPGERHVEVAGALIDTKRMDALIDQIGLNTVNLSDKALVLKANTAAIAALVDVVHQARATVEHHTKVSVEVHKHAEELAEEMRELRTETRELREENRRLRDEMLRAGRPR